MRPRFLTFVFMFAVLLLGLRSLAAAEAPSVPSDASKAELVAYQEELTRWGNENSKSLDEFWEKTGDLFYASTKELLERDLTASERADYNVKLAGLLGNYALREALDAKGELGARFEELRLLVARTGSSWSESRDDVDLGAFLSCAEQMFAVRLKVALNKTDAARDEALAELVGDSISFALRVPAFGEKTCGLITSIRAFVPELGQEAYDAMCDAFDASGEPALAKPVQQALGARRYRELVGSELYFDALLLKNGEFKDKLDLNDYRGKVVLVEVWATWCGPCRKEIPRLKEVYAKYRDAGMEIVGYSIDRDLERLKSFLVENEIPWPMTSQTASVESGARGLYEYYSIEGVPEMILIGRDGKVVMTDARGYKLANALKELFPDVEPLDWTIENDFSARVREEGK